MAACIDRCYRLPGSLPEPKDPQCNTPPSAAPAFASASPASAPAAFSRLGLKAGKSEDEAARLIHEAVGLGINFIDTAASYGTEGVVGRALKTIPRDQVVIATKAQFRGNPWAPPEKVVAALDNSLRLMGTDYVDVFNLHGVEIDEYDYAIETNGAGAARAESARARSGTSASPRIRSSISPTRC